MITFEKGEKRMVIPSALGNFNNGGGGSGSGVTPEEVIVIVESAITEYDTELQVDLEDMRDDIEAVQEGIEAVSGVTSGMSASVEELRQGVEALSGATSGFSASLEELSGATSGISENLDTLSASTHDSFLRMHQNVVDLAEQALRAERTANSAYTVGDSAYTLANSSYQLANSAYTLAESYSGVTADLAGLSGSTAGIASGVETLSGVTSGLAEDVEALSAATAGISKKVVYHVEDLDNMSYVERRAWFVGLVNEVNAGSTVFMEGASTKSGFTVQLPLVEFRTGTYQEDYGYNGGLARFDAKAKEDVEYYFFDITSAGNITGVGTGLNSSKLFPQKLLPTAAANTKGGVRVGSGLDMNGEVMSVKVGEGLGFSGDTLVVSGISSEQNYVIVDDLSEITSPYAGLEAYRRAYVETATYTGWTIDASQIDENYAAHIYSDGQTETPVYHNSQGFHWDWDNDADGELRPRDDYYYTINGERTVLSVFFNNPDAYITLEENVTTAATATTISISHAATTYRYNGVSWEEYQPPKTYYLDNMTDVERIALYNEIFRYSESTFPAGNYRFFVYNEGSDGYQGMFEVFVARFYPGISIAFSGIMQNRYAPEIIEKGFELSSSGGFSENFSNTVYFPGVGSDLTINIDSNGYISTSVLDGFGDLAKFSRFVFAYNDENVTNNHCAAPLKYFYRRTESINGEDKLVEYIGVEININGTWYKGDWHFIEYEWGDSVAPDTWTTL